MSGEENEIQWDTGDQSIVVDTDLLESDCAKRWVEGRLIGALLEESYKAHFGLTGPITFKYMKLANRTEVRATAPLRPFDDNS